jgi:hypothetical protein
MDRVWLPIIVGTQIWDPHKLMHARKDTSTMLKNAWKRPWGVQGVTGLPLYSLIAPTPLRAAMPFSSTAAWGWLQGATLAARGPTAGRSGNAGGPTLGSSSDGGEGGAFKGVAAVVARGQICDAASRR